MEQFTQKVLNLTRTLPIVETFFLESQAPDEIAIIPFILASLSGCILLLQQVVPMMVSGKRKTEVGGLYYRKVRLLLMFVICHAHTRHVFVDGT